MQPSSLFYQLSQRDCLVLFYNSYISMNNGGDFQSEGASWSPRFPIRRMDWCQSTCFSTVFVGTFEIYPSWRINETSKQSSACHRYFMLPSQICHCAARDCHIVGPACCCFSKWLKEHKHVVFVFVLLRDSAKQITANCLSSTNSIRVSPRAKVARCVTPVEFHRSKSQQITVKEL